MNILKKLFFVSLLSISSLGFSAVSLSGNVALTSDYVWRGMTQNAGDPSISGGFDLEDDSGFYLGAWAANVASADSTAGTTGSIELDGYLGFSGSFNEDAGYDVGFIAYTYPGVDTWDFEAIYSRFDFFCVCTIFSNLSFFCRPNKKRSDQLRKKTLSESLTTEL